MFAHLLFMFFFSLLREFANFIYRFILFMVHSFVPYLRFQITDIYIFFINEWGVCLFILFAKYLLIYLTFVFFFSTLHRDCNNFLYLWCIHSCIIYSYAGKENTFFLYLSFPWFIFSFRRRNVWCVFALYVAIDWNALLVTY